MSTIGIINISIEIFGSLLSLIIIFLLYISKAKGTRLNLLYTRILLCNSLLLISDAIAWAAKGSPSLFSFYAVRIANFFVFSLGYVMMSLFTDYLVAYLRTRAEVPAGYTRIMWFLTAVAMILVIVSQFNHMYYRIDESNMYQRQGLFWLSQVWGILGMAITGHLLLRYKKHLARWEFYCLLSYVVLPAIAMLIQIFVYGLALLYIVTTIAILIIYMGIQVVASRQYQEKEMELMESRIAIMLSQIQPHFLYNSLTVIKQLCDIDPAAAKEAVVDFSGYLRGNLDSLTRKSPILFEKELEHVATYLSLEKKRFEDRLTVHYEIEASGFFLPALTIQPLVENAVRHGVLKKDDGGTVTIRSEELENAWRVTVSDDGVGFDPHAGFNEDGDSHIGIENVKNRLTAMCGGTLSVVSSPERGTIATVTIPKEEL